MGFFVCSVFEGPCVCCCCSLWMFFFWRSMCNKILQKPWPQRVGIILLGWSLGTKWSFNPNTTNVRNGYPPWDLQLAPENQWLVNLYGIRPIFRGGSCSLSGVYRKEWVGTRESPIKSRNHFIGWHRRKKKGGIDQARKWTKSSLNDDTFGDGRCQQISPSQRWSFSESNERPSGASTLKKRSP